MDRENLGPAEKIVGTVISQAGHLYHGRPGIVTTDQSSVTGVKWAFATHKMEDGKKVAYLLDKAGNKTVKKKAGTVGDDAKVRDDAGKIVGEYRGAGISPEVATWMYARIAEVWELDHEFAARWASYQYVQDHRDMKAVMAAFMLVQSRKGDPILDGGKVAFYDEDFRDVGEAMVLLHEKESKLRPKDLLRIREVLTVPGVVEINRKLGFGKSARKPFLGRWEKAVEKWLRYREENPKLLTGLVKEGYRTTIMELSRSIGYKPTTAKFFETLRWKQAQAGDGRRTMAVGKSVAAAESWEGMDEEQICKKIVSERPGYKRIVGLVPKSVGITRAVMAAAIEAGSLSDKDLVIVTATLEELGLLQVPDVRERWEKATKAADDMRAANIAARVKSKDVREKLQEAADVAVQKAVAEVSKGMRIYFFVDISGSMEGAIEAAKAHVAKFLQGFPPENVHVATFNTIGREIKIKHASAAGVQNAFAGIKATGGTSYASGIQALIGHRPSADEDVLCMFVGDEQDPHEFDKEIRQSGLSPMAFGLIPVFTAQYGRGTVVRATAAALGIPCFEIDEKTFADPYSIPRTIRAVVAATPVNRTGRTTPANRVAMAEAILRTEILKKPSWAA